MKRRNRFAAILLSFVIASGGMQTVAFAEEAEIEEDPYVYQYKEGEDWDASSHTTHVEYEDGSKKDVRAHIFRLENTEARENGEPETETEEDSAAYCCDIKTVIQSEQEYRKINLEDATYFDDETAAQLRTIVNTGYWHDWTEEDIAALEAAANQWLTAQEKTESVESLTADEALSATQAAIWQTAGGLAADPEIKSFAPYSGNAEAAKNNIELLYEYLLSQPPAASDKVLFTEENFIADQAISGGLGTMTLCFRLAGTISAEDDLKLSAALGDRKALEFLLTGEGRLMPDEKGIYSISFDGVTEAELKTAIRLAIAGRQMTNGAYFFEAKPAEGSDPRATSQNLIGRAIGMTPVYAEARIDLSKLLEGPDGSAADDSVSERPAIEAPTADEVSQLEGERKQAGSCDREAVYAAVMDRAVETGDDFHTGFWVAAMMAALFLAGSLLSASKQKLSARKD